MGSLTDQSGQGTGAISSFCLAPSGSLVPFHAAVPAGLEYLSSSHGYLALTDPRTSSPKAIVLANPVNDRRVQLPPVGFFKKWIDVTAAVLSADPAAAAEWSAVAVGFPTSCLAHYSSVTGAWRRLGFSVNGYVGVEHYNGRFYVAFKSQLCVLEVDGDAPAVIPLELEHVDIVGSDDDEKVPGSGKRVIETHLVECDGELLLVSVHDGVEYSSDVVDIISGHSRTVEVHRVEWHDGDPLRLVKVVNLGWNALFLGRNQAFALSPAEFPACRVNCIYLVDRQGHPDGLVRVFHMESQWSRRQETICPDDGLRGVPASVIVLILSRPFQRQY
ncbi:hypothetical protein QOZ80_2AG0114020 [Eleusine coracana subsp. coracana]|nr:hypothetical protein QOZ80_2AG0114020 [Eleusine coracana subsp. coracana]